jgi:hypothetical protein
MDALVDKFIAARLHHLEPAAADDDIGTVSPESAGDFLADAGTATGNQRHLSL